MQLSKRDTWEGNENPATRRGPVEIIDAVKEATILNTLDFYPLR